MATKIKQSFFRDVNPMKLKPVTSLRSCLFDSVRVISIQTRRNNIASQLKRGNNQPVHRKEARRGTLGPCRSIELGDLCTPPEACPKLYVHSSRPYLKTNMNPCR